MDTSSVEEKLQEYELLQSKIKNSNMKVKSSQINEILIRNNELIKGIIIIIMFH